jgi:hypothetical protein
MEAGRATHHGALGIASFIMSVVVILLVFVSVGVAGYLQTTGQYGSPLKTLVGLVIIFCALLVVITIGLAIAGLFDYSSKKAFPIIGLSISIGTLLVIAGIMAIGLAAMQQAKLGQ